MFYPEHFVYNFHKNILPEESSSEKHTYTAQNTMNGNVQCSPQQAVIILVYILSYTAERLLKRMSNPFIQSISSLLISTGKNAFRVSFVKHTRQNQSRAQSHTLLASSEHDKRQWIQFIQKSIDSVTDCYLEKRCRDREDDSVVPSVVKKETLC